jgi:hypothetical protein
MFQGKDAAATAYRRKQNLHPPGTYRSTSIFPNQLQYYDAYIGLLIRHHVDRAAVNSTTYRCTRGWLL